MKKKDFLAHIKSISNQNIAVFRDTGCNLWAEICGRFRGKMVLYEFNLLGFIGFTWTQT